MGSAILALMYSRVEISIGFYYHSSGIDPGVESIASNTQVRLVEFVVLSPAERHVSKTLLDDT